MRLDNSGFSIAEVLISVGLTSILTMTAYTILFQAYASKETLERSIEVKNQQIDIRDNLSHFCSLYKTMKEKSNGLSNCLYKGDCPTSEVKNISFIDFKSNKQEMFLYNQDGTYCNQSDCPIVGSISAYINCNKENPGDPCHSSMLQLNLSWEYKGEIARRWDNIEVATNLPRVYQSCQEVANEGEVASGLYWIEAEKYNLGCPVQVHCDISFGNGKALVSNALQEDYEELEEVPPPLTPISQGRLDQDLVDIILGQSTNNRMNVQIDTNSSGVLSLNFLANNINNNRQVYTNPSSCSPVNTTFEPPQAVAKSPSYNLFSKKNKSFIGYFSKNGFQCTSCGETMCGVFALGCCKQKMRGRVYAY